MIESPSPSSPSSDISSLAIITRSFLKLNLLKLVAAVKAMPSTTFVSFSNNLESKVCKMPLGLRERRLRFCREDNLRIFEEEEGGGNDEVEDDGGIGGGVGGGGREGGVFKEELDMLV